MTSIPQAPIVPALRSLKVRASQSLVSSSLSFDTYHCNTSDWLGCGFVLSRILFIYYIDLGHSAARTRSLRFGSKRLSA
jgi:hypothetical protein